MCPCLQRPISGQILSAEEMFEFCKTNITGISFLFVSEKDTMLIGKVLESRFEKSLTVRNTREYHSFVPLPDKTMCVRKVSTSKDFKIVKVLKND